MSLMMWTRTRLFDQTTPHDGSIHVREDRRVARVDWMDAERVNSPGNVLVVERLAE
jgi:peptide subunit release factor RF-3